MKDVVSMLAQKEPDETGTTDDNYSAYFKHMTDLVKDNFKADMDTILLAWDEATDLLKAVSPVPLVALTLINATAATHALTASARVAAVRRG